MARSGGTRWTRLSGQLPKPRPEGDIAVDAARYVRRACSLSTTNASWLRCWSTAQMATLLVVTKGAPEVVLERCRDVPDGARSALEALFSEGARVVAVATRSGAGFEVPDLGRRAGT